VRAWMATHDRFVLKPASGHGGEGILLVRGKTGTVYDTSMGPLTEAQVEEQALAILAGEYGGDHQDAAVLEELLEPHPALKEFSPIGLADVRVVSAPGHPLLARVPL